MQNRTKWLQLLKVYGVLLARQQGENGRALYAWLYRNDKHWLIKSNFQYRKDHISDNHRVDWVQRDQVVYHQLLKIKDLETSHPDVARRSRHWYLSHLTNSRTIEKNLYKLPLTNTFLNSFSESVGQYQIRRIKNAIEQLDLYGKSKARWRILRLARLSEERLQEESSDYLNKIFSAYINSSKV